MAWIGDTICDFCKRDCRTVGETFYDAKTVHSGAWALMCKECYPVHAKSEILGSGHGQQYSSVSGEKVAG